MEGGRSRAFPKALPKAAVIKVVLVCFEVWKDCYWSCEMMVW
jgi:hypothetical protein